MCFACLSAKKPHTNTNKGEHNTNELHQETLGRGEDCMELARMTCGRTCGPIGSVASSPSDVLASTPTAANAKKKTLHLITFLQLLDTVS